MFMNGDSNLNKIRVFKGYDGTIDNNSHCCLNCKNSKYSLKIHKWYCTKTGRIIIAENICDNFSKLTFEWE